MSLDPMVGDDELDSLGAAWEEFVRAVRRARASTGERSTELSLSQYEFLSPLADGDGLPVSQLAERFGVAPATATRILDALERSELIERSRDAEDRRTVTITLTAQGHHQLADKRRSITDKRRALLATISPDERATTTKLLQDLARVIGEI